MGFKDQPLNSPTGASLQLYLKETTDKPKAVVHLNHGMCEHMSRYERFATALTDNGYHVVGHDHRGHGYTTAADAPQGQFAGQDGFQKVIADVDAVNAHIRTKYPDLPIVYFGHSMGAIIGLNYCIQHSKKIAAAALWNSGVDGGLLLTVYGFLLKLERMFKGSDVPSQIAKKLAFEDWNKKFKPNRTQSDWLTRDEAEVDQYLADPLCGFDATNSLWGDLLEGVKTGADDAQLAKIRNDLPMHLLAGGKDPCSDNGKGVERLYTRLQKQGINDITFKLHPDNRHEALNELNRNEVMQEFIDWLDVRFG
jgi:alpha-beta hydrolase superfamily lysophospholipase